MEKENNDILDDTIPHRYMTDEEKAQTALLSEKSFLKERYRHALKITTENKIQEYAQTHPAWTIKEVLIAVLKSYNAQLPAVVLLEMAQFIALEWGKILAAKKELVYD